ncbi:MAG TPA: ASPIC/UnbV domain-containing protein, partial [Ilumatobacteraceae bacterium]|nr:ASPIC/UnbV domain-containing protein [Ilumatobacteraceae bacterium]
KVGDQVVQREVTVGGGHASGQLVPVHFGLGDAEQAEVRVQWPNGDVGPWIRVDADQVVTVAP